MDFINYHKNVYGSKVVKVVRVNLKLLSWRAPRFDSQQLVNIIIFLHHLILGGHNSKIKENGRV